MIKVKASDRVGGLPGQWRISKALAKKLCNGILPRCGCEHLVAQQPGVVWNDDRTVSFACTFQAWVVNVANAEFRLRDENHILDVEELPGSHEHRGCRHYE